MDIGCYNISLSRYIFGEEPRRVVGVVEHDPKFRTDRLASAILEFSKGTATFSCSTQLSPYQRVNLFGTQGRLEIDIPFNAPPDRPCRVWIQADGEIQEIELPTVDQYTIQGELMSAAILEDQPVPTPLTDAVQNMLVIEAIKTSAAENRWVSL